MFQLADEQMIVVFPLLMGSVAILLALLYRPLQRFLGLKPMSQLFTTPRFQRSARITEKLGRLLLVVIGIGGLVEGIGPLFLPEGIILVIAQAAVGLSVLILLAVIGVVLVNWKSHG